MTMSRFFNITTSDDGTSTIFLYGDIGDYTEVQSGRIAQELMEAERVSRRIHVRINSNGGEVYSGMRYSTPCAIARPTSAFMWMA